MKEMERQKHMSVRALTVPEAAERLGITERAAWQRLYRGMLPHRRWGKRVIVLESELLAFLKALPGPTLDDVIAKSEEESRW